MVTKDARKPVLVIASGINRIEESLIEAHIGAKIEKATAEEVRNATGYAIGLEK